MTKEIKEVSQGYKINQGSNYVYVGNYEARRLMAQSSVGNLDPELPRNYYISTDGRRVYHTEESKRLAEIRAASTQVFKRNMRSGSIGNNNNNHNNITTNDNEEEVLPREVTESNNNILNKGMRDADLPLMFRIATRTIPNPQPSDSRAATETTRPQCGKKSANDTTHS